MSNTIFSGPRSQPVCEEIHNLFQSGFKLNSACNLRNTLTLVTGESKFNQGTQEDSHEFLLTTLNALERELEHSVEGIGLMKKFWGKEEFLQKFTYPRLVLSFTVINTSLYFYFVNSALDVVQCVAICQVLLKTLTSWHWGSQSLILLWISPVY